MLQLRSIEASCLDSERTWRANVMSIEATTHPRPKKPSHRDWESRPTEAGDSGLSETHRLGLLPGVLDSAQPGMPDSAQPGHQSLAQPSHQSSARPGHQNSAQPGGEDPVSRVKVNSAQPGDLHVGWLLWATRNSAQAAPLAFFFIACLFPASLYF